MSGLCCPKINLKGKSHNSQDTRALFNEQQQANCIQNTFLKFSKILDGSTNDERNSKIFDTGFTNWNAVINSVSDKQLLRMPTAILISNFQKCHLVADTCR